MRFRHPLVRSAVYRAAPPHDRRSAHLALAQATDAHADPDRRAWHLAAATEGPNEEVALELERSADRARARGGLTAAAAFLRRSVALTKEPNLRVERALAAAQASLHAGEFPLSLEVLATAETVVLDDLQRARVDLLRGQIVTASSGLSEAPGLLLEVAIRLEPLDLALARESYLDAWGAALFAGKSANANMRDISRVVRAAAHLTPEPRGSDLLLDGMSMLMTEGRTAAAPTIRRAISSFLNEDLAVDKGMRWSTIASCASIEVWDFETWDAIITRQMQLARDAGALGPLSLGLTGKAVVVAWTGDFDAAGRVAAEADAVNEATGSREEAFGGLFFAALRGREDEAFAVFSKASETAAANGAGFALQWVQWVTAILCNGLGRYEEALAAAQQAWDEWPDWFVAVWALPELIEPASRLGQPDRGTQPLRDLIASAEVGGSDWGLGIAARSKALLSDDAAAEALYQEAVRRLGSTPLRLEVARAHLLYGEWLRRQQRRVDAREQLGVAHSMLSAMGAEGFAERARHELLATGAKVRQRHAMNARRAHPSRSAHHPTRRRRAHERADRCAPLPQP